MDYFRIEHTMLCAVNVWRVIAAENIEQAFEKAKAIETVTASGECDYEIVCDLEMLELTVKHDAPIQGYKP
jgi:uncharacterized protein YggE